MLACGSEKASLECAKILLAAGLSSKVMEKAGQNNLLHICAQGCPNNEVLSYLVKNLPELLFERNKKGETPLTICQSVKNTEGVTLLKSLESQYDHTGQKAGDLLAQLEAEEEREQRDKARRKEKKYRSKITKIAQKGGFSVE